MRGNKRALELYQNLGKLPEQLAGDEHGREVLAPGDGGHGGGWFGWRAEETGGLLYVAQRDQGDEGVMGEMLAVLRRLGARAYGGGTADGPPVRGVRARTAALASGRLGTGRVGARVWTRSVPVVGG
jgi:hypothetical protein